jgi:hypothetical protein
MLLPRAWYVGAGEEIGAAKRRGGILQASVPNEAIPFARLLEALFVFSSNLVR